jgi:hypothetical protein
MATIHVEQPTSSTPEEVLKRFEAEVLTLPNFKVFVDRYEIKDNRVTFDGSKGFSGTVEAKPGNLVVDITLSGMATLMKPLVESKLKYVLEKLA